MTAYIPGRPILVTGVAGFIGMFVAKALLEAGETVVGIDNSPAMIEEARRLFPEIEFQLADAHEFSFEQPFDGVFSNAALHWIKDPARVAHCLRAVLKGHGRMAVEFGGQGNVRFLAEAIEAASEEFLGERLPHPWYFPSIVAFGTVLEQHGMEVLQAAMIDRPTPLEGDDGLKNWVRMFGQHWLAQITAEQHETFLERVEAMARPHLFRDSTWFADYRRIRVQARAAHG